MKKIILIIIFINIFTSNIVFANQNPSITPSLLSSKHIIVLDRKTLLPLYEKNAYQKTAMASTTKILTCIIALENSNQTDIVTISKKAANISGSCLGLKSNTQISMKNLLYGLMLRSGNDCAIAIAEHISGSVEEFSILMNQKALELGLFDSNFITPHGLDNENHYTTAYDLAILTNYALKNPDFKKIVSTKKTTISYNNTTNEISNTNELLGSLDGVYGVKTGFTFEAGRCLVSACKRDSLDIIVVVLGADTKSIRTKDSINLINYIFSNYEYTNISKIVDNSFNNYILYFNQIYKLEKTSSIPKLLLERLENYDFPILKDNISNLTTKIYTITNFNSYVSKGNIVGKLEVYNNEEMLCSNNIILENELITNPWSFYFKKILSYYKQ